MIAKSLVVAFILIVAAPVSAENRSASEDSLDPAKLELASVHAVVADLESGRTLYRKSADYVVPIASITKVMTAMVVLDSRADLDEWLTVLARDKPAPNNAYTRLRTGSKARRRDLLRIALMSSENKAAYVLARYYPGGLPAFVAAMNDKAEALGMEHSHFVDPTGLSSKNRSTADDLLRLVRAGRDYPLIREFTDTAHYTVRFRDPGYRLNYGNTNVLVYRGDWDIALSKTGYLDEAGRCLILVTTIEERPVAMVLLDSFGLRTPVGDAGRIRRWLETGESGSIAAAARRYERRRSAQLANADLSQ
jgi:D-alanyl-D-alanine endopeptidase (penicillin-binding protein 7)